MNHRKIYFFFILLLLLSLPLTVLGAEGPGDGSGSGANKVIRLTLEKSYPQNREGDFPFNDTIQLNFNKNVCNVSVLPINKDSFHLTDSSGKVVPITLIFPDDQVQRTYKREVFILPQEPLTPGTTYRIAVDRTLKAKNGTYIDNAHIVTFTAGSRTATGKNAILTELGDNIHTYSSALAETSDSKPLTDEELLNGPDEKGISTENMVRILVPAILLVLVIFTLLILRKRGRRSQ